MDLERMLEEDKPTYWSRHTLKTFLMSHPHLRLMTYDELLENKEARQKIRDHQTHITRVWVVGENDIYGCSARFEKFTVDCDIGTPLNWECRIMLVDTNESTIKG